MPALFTAVNNSSAQCKQRIEHETHAWYIFCLTSRRLCL